MWALVKATFRRSVWKKVSTCRGERKRGFENEILIDAVQGCFVVISVRHSICWRNLCGFVEQSSSATSWKRNSEFSRITLGTSESAVSESIALDAAMTRNLLQQDVMSSSSDLVMNRSHYLYQFNGATLKAGRLSSLQSCACFCKHSLRIWLSLRSTLHGSSNSLKLRRCWWCLMVEPGPQCAVPRGSPYHNRWKV